MSVRVMTVGVMSVGEITVGVMNVGVMRRPQISIDVQLIILFISLTKIKNIVENLDELCFQCSCTSMFT
jgi:uncharacterized protein (DUF169 family)